MLKLFPLMACLMLIASSAPASSHPLMPPATFDPAAVDSYISQVVQSRELVGLSVAMAKNGAIAMEGVYGKSSLADGTRVTADTVFAIGSVTKQFTAACIFILAQEGKLSVNDKVSKYYPNLTRAGDITLLDLMNHVSGYADYYPLDFVDSRMEAAIAPDDLIQRFAGGKLDFEPGTKWSYSNTGFVILGRVVEKVTGQSLGDFMTQRILQPLGMSHSFYGPRAAGGAIAQGYSRFGLGPQKPATPEAESWLLGAAGLHCTAGDLIKWDMALIDGRVINAESYDLMTRPRKLAEGRIREYGCGIGVKTISNTVILAHEGEVSGFQAWNVIVPATHSAVVILSNCEETGVVNDLHSDLARLIMPDAPWVPAITGADAGEAAMQFLRSLQAGNIDRGNLGDEFSRYLTAEKVRDSSARVAKLGPPLRAQVENRSERGGMEVAEIEVVCKKGTISALLYRTPDGKVQECLFQPGR